MNKFEELVSILVPGEKYTIVAPGDFGFTYSKKIKFVSAEIKPYAQHKQALWFRYREFRKQQDRQIVYYQDLPVVYKGFIEVDTNPFKKVVSRSNGVTVLTSEARAFDDVHLENAKKSVDQEPIFGGASDLAYNTKWRDTAVKVEVIKADDSGNFTKEEYNTLEEAQILYPQLRREQAMNGGDGVLRFENQKASQILSS